MGSTSRQEASYGLPRSTRLRSARDFRAVYRRGMRARGANLQLVAYRRPGPGLRLGLSVSKANGPAVRRNKIKRILREAFRLERPTLPSGFDIVLIPMPRPRYRLAEVRGELRSLLQGLSRRATSHPPRRAP